jgi:hypothetical protein
LAVTLCGLTDRGTFVSPKQCYLPGSPYGVASQKTTSGIEVSIFVTYGLSSQRYKPDSDVLFRCMLCPNGMTGQGFC